MTSFFLRKPHYIILAIFIAGILCLLSLQWVVPDGAYFSGDSGLKALVSQNLAGGQLRFDLGLPDPPWIKALWSKGLFPYEEPFVYHIHGSYYSTFPYTFSLVTAPFYALFGYRGLYLVPWLATLIIWWVFYRLCRRLGIAPAITAVGMFFLIFAANLSLYSAMYWEHTLSVCLAFGGLSLMFPRKNGEPLSPWAAAGAGVLTGLSVWFRPEQIFLFLFLSLVSLWTVIKSIWPGAFPRINTDPLLGHLSRVGWVYIVASLLTLLLYGASNWLVYRNFFGVHAIQVLANQSILERIKGALENLQLLTYGSYAFVWYVPVVLVPLGVLILLLTRWGRGLMKPEWALLYVFCLLFGLGVVVLVPPGAGGKQWGPRFLLLLVPVVTLMFTWQMDALIKSGSISGKRGGWVALAVILLGLVGIYQNPIRGREFLITNYSQVSATVAALRNDPAPVIGISSPFLGQVFQPALSRDVDFLLVDNDEQLAWLSQALVAQHQDGFVYICYSNSCDLFDKAPAIKSVFVDGNGYLLQTSNIRPLGRYTLVDVQVSRKPGRKFGDAVLVEQVIYVHLMTKGGACFISPVCFEFNSKKPQSIHSYIQKTVKWLVSFV